METEFSVTSRDLPGFHIVALHGELDIVSAYDLALALVEVAGSTVVAVDLSDLTFMGFHWHDSSGDGEEAHPGRRTGPADAHKTGRDRSYGFGDRGAEYVDRGLVARLG